jgi:hypothetical protein
VSTATLTPTLLDQIAGTLGVTDTELGRLFGVRRQAIGQWRDRGIPAARQAKAATLAATAELLRRQLKTERIPGIVRKPARAYGGLSALEMIERDRHVELQEIVRRSFDWAIPA